MPFFVCPVCGRDFSSDSHTLRCENGHAFDLARQGYVNLLRSQKSSEARHGDDKIMVASRTVFLDAGFYQPLRDRIAARSVSLLRASGNRAPVCLDAGCGEGYYTAHLRRELCENGFSPLVAGIDISKEAILACARRDRAIELAVGSLFSIPATDASADLIWNLFAPNVPAEFSRVLKRGGFLFRVFPAEKHLWELKAAVYDVPYENEIDSIALDGFSLIDEETVSFPLSLPDPETIFSLFCMTPYYYKTGANDQKKLFSLSHLDTRAEFRLAVYQK